MVTQLSNAAKIAKINNQTIISLYTNKLSDDDLSLSFTQNDLWTNRLTLLLDMQVAITKAINTANAPDRQNIQQSGSNLRPYEPTFTQNKELLKTNAQKVEQEINEVLNTVKSEKQLPLPELQKIRAMVQIEDISPACKQSLQEINEQFSTPDPKKSTVGEKKHMLSPSVTFAKHHPPAQPKEKVETPRKDKLHTLQNKLEKLVRAQVSNLIDEARSIPDKWQQLKDGKKKKGLKGIFASGLKEEKKRRKKGPVLGI